MLYAAPIVSTGMMLHWWPWIFQPITPDWFLQECYIATCHITPPPMSRGSQTARASPGPSRGAFSADLWAERDPGLSWAQDPPSLPPSHASACHSSARRFRRRQGNISGNISIFSLVKGVFQSNRCCGVCEVFKRECIWQLSQFCIFLKKHRYFQGMEVHTLSEWLCPEKRVKSRFLPLVAIFKCEPYLK